MNDELTKDEWAKIKAIIFSLLDLTWEYFEPKANKVIEELEATKPTRIEKESFSNINQKLLDWNQSKTETHSLTFNKAKTESINLVKELEEFLTKLGLPKSRTE